MFQQPPKQNKKSQLKMFIAFARWNFQIKSKIEYPALFKRVYTLWHAVQVGVHSLSLSLRLYKCIQCATC